jgi:hypothetical protein
MKPVMPSQSDSFYSRVFPSEYGGYPRQNMVDLANWIKDTAEHRCNRPRSIPGLIPSGYVYFTQFVNHDLSYDATKLSEAGEVSPEATPNYRTPRLDLEILYGSGTTKNGYLKLGSTIQTLNESSSDNDLDRDATGMAMIYDKRNDSTLLLGQLHVLLCKFHNRLLDDVIAGKVPSISEGDPIEQTKRLVTWHYQWIIRNDLLPKLVMPDVLQDITLHWPRLYRPRTGSASIPVEFSLAAFQFGHAAVNFLYNINRNLISCPQEATMYLTGFGHFQWPVGTGTGFTRLPEKFVVDSGRLFGWAPRAKQNFAAIIGTLITEGLYRIPGTLSVLLNNEPVIDTGLTVATRKGISTFSLPEATLLRGSAVGLPSGQQACELAGVHQLGPDQLAYDDNLHQFLARNGMLHRTPLFYYLLREAEVAGRPAPDRPPGTRLGPLGSRIVAEVILGVLTADPDAFVHFDWQPPNIAGNSRRTQIRIDSLKKMMFYATGYTGRRL